MAGGNNGCKPGFPTPLCLLLAQLPIRHPLSFHVSICPCPCPPHQPHGPLQEKCEPPVYVSDRRLVKAVALMQVAAYTCGRSRVAEYDCLLLRHILWQRPDEAERIYDWLLK